MPLPSLPPIDTTEWAAYSMRRLRVRAHQQLAERAQAIPRPQPRFSLSDLAALPSGAGPASPGQPAAGPPPAQTTRPSQLPGAQPELTSAEALAACGPVAAIAFAQRMGRNPTAREAVDLAKGVGWTQGQGMAGPGSEK